MKVALYARVSSGHQEQEQTIESQLEALRANVREHGYELEEKHVYVDDGIIGARMDRPGLDRLRDAARDGEFKAVVVYDVDRLARKFVYQEVLREELRQHGCEMMALKGHIGQTPEDQMLVQMQGVFAEYERAKIFDRTRRGRLFKAKQGQFLPWAWAPYGYRYIRSQAGQGGHAQIHEEEAGWVRKIFSWVADEGLSARQIARRLTEHEVPTKRGRQVWARGTICEILHNPVYIGKAYYNRHEAVEPRRPRDPERYRKIAKTSRRLKPASEWIEIPVPALVDEETFLKARERLQANRRDLSGRVPTANRYLLRNLVRCRQCGRRMGCSSKGKYFYYTCPGKDRWELASLERCRARLIRSDRLDEAVWNRLMELIKNPDMLLQHLRGLQESYSTEERDELAQVSRLAELLQQARLQVQRLIDAYQSGLIHKPELAQRRNKLEERIQSLEAQQREAERRREQENQQQKLAENVQGLCDALRRGIEDATFDDRRRVVRLLVEDVVVKENDVTLRHIIPVTKITAN